MDEQIKHCTEQRKKGEIECVNRKNDNMENDRCHEKANTNSLEGDDNGNADSEGVEGPFGPQSVVDRCFLV